MLKKNKKFHIQYIDVKFLHSYSRFKKPSLGLHKSVKVFTTKGFSLKEIMLTFSFLLHTKCNDAISKHQNHYLCLCYKNISRYRETNTAVCYENSFKVEELN